MTAPLIGISSENTHNEYGQAAIRSLRTYTQAVIKAGGVPVIIPGETPQDLRKILFSRLDGIILSGGNDIDPQLFNGEAHPAIGEIDPLRDACEMHLARMAIKKGKPILGICRGAQLINILLGGDLYTHIDDQYPNNIAHNFYPDHPRDLLSHRVRIDKSSKLFQIIREEEISVNSLHHQGIKTLAPQLAACAHAPDGLVEAVEIPEHPFALAVQWHPEWLPKEPSAQALFQALIDAAKG